MKKKYNAEKEEENSSGSKNSVISLPKLKETQKIYLHFNVDYYTHFGQEIYLFGNIPELGNFDVNNAVKMKYENEHSWSCTVEISVEGGEIVFEYRYFVTHGYQIIDEEVEESHAFKIQNVVNGDSFLIDDSFHTNFIFEVYSSANNCQKGLPIVDSTVALLLPETLDDNCVCLSISAYAPTVKDGQRMKVVIEGSEQEYFFDSSAFPYFGGNISIPRSQFPIKYRYATVFPDGKTCFENQIHSARVEHKLQKVVRIDDWIVKPN